MTLQILPDLRTLHLDEGFSYAGSPTPQAVTGSIVRIPLGGRVVRGWVLDSDDGNEEGLRHVSAVSGDLPVFDPTTLTTLKRISAHYVAPLASIIRSASPPNLPRNVSPKWEETDWVPLKSPFRTHLSVADPWNELRGQIQDEQARGGSVLVIVPTMEEVDHAAEKLEGVPSLQVLDRQTSDRSATTIWSRVRATGGGVVVGTARCALWPIRHLGLVVLIDEGRRSHKARQSPTLHTRTLLDARVECEGLRLITTGTVPSTETVNSGAVLGNDSGRKWGVVEVVDRGLEPPGRGIFDDRMKAGIHWAVREAKSVAVFTHRKGFAPAFRCVTCGELRRCPKCGSRAITLKSCERCLSELRGCLACSGERFEPMGLGIGRLVSALQRLWGSDVGVLGEKRLVTAVTEGDLPKLDQVDLAIIVDADGMLFGTNYRAAEDAVRTMARVAGLARERTLIQTLSPSAAGIKALQEGTAEQFIRAELVQRKALGFPPCGATIVVEVRGGPPDTAQRMAELGSRSVQVFGPHESADGARWLVQGPDLNDAKVKLREVADWLRRQGTKVRIDVDPLDL